MANCAKHRTLQKKVFIDPLELQRFKTISIPQKNMRKGKLSFFAEVGIEVAVTIGVTKNRNYYKATILKGEMKVDSQNQKCRGNCEKAFSFLLLEHSLFSSGW